MPNSAIWRCGSACADDGRPPSDVNASAAAAYRRSSVVFRCVLVMADSFRAKRSDGEIEGNPGEPRCRRENQCQDLRLAWGNMEKPRGQSQHGKHEADKCCSPAGGARVESEHHL